MPADLAPRFDAIEAFVRAGRLQQARHHLREIIRRGVPESHAVTAASLARRLGLFSLGVKLLNPLVRPSEKSFRVPLPDEQAEYAAALVKIGAPEEALALLEALDPEEQPQARLFRAFALMSQWRYREALPELTKYVGAGALTPYQRLVGKVNLAAALVHERLGEPAERTLEELRGETERGGHVLLEGNALELSAQHAISDQKWDRAAEYLRQAEGKLAEAAGPSAFYVRKWRAVLDLLRLSGSKAALQTVESVQREARERKNWETIRDLDRFKGLALRDDAIFRHLYFGTPFAAFREQLVAAFAKAAPLDESYSWQLGGKGGGRLDLLEREVRRGRGTRALELPPLLHQLLLVLCSDFYRPLRLAELHFRLYPRQVFNPVSSAHRVHQALKRLRHFLSSTNSPLEIEVSADGYRLRSSRPCDIRLGVAPGDADKVGRAVRRLRSAWGERAFSAPEAKARLGLSLRTMVRLLSEAEARGRVTRSGKARATRYRLVDKGLPIASSRDGKV